MIPKERTKVFHWKEIDDLDYQSIIPVDATELDVAGHSLGGYGVMEFARRVDGTIIDRVIPITGYMFDPVPGDENHPWMQFGSDPMTVPPSIIDCTCYLKRQGFPFSQPLAYADDRMFRNIYVNGDHNSMVMNAADDFMKRLERD